MKRKPEAHRGPSAASLREMPEIDFAKAKLRANPYAARIAKEDTNEQVWLVKVYEVCPKAIHYLGDEKWTDCQRGAKRFPSKSAAHTAAKGIHDAVLVRLRPRSEKRT